MKIGRKTLALALTATALPIALINLGGTASASTWSYYKLPGGTGSEPGIDVGVDADGNEVIYVHGTFGAPGHNKAWIRQPDLAAYKPPNPQPFKPITFTNPYSRLPGGGDADIAFRGNDMWFIDLWVGSNSIQYSPDKGATWTLGTPFTTLPLSDRQWIALGDTVIDENGDPQTTVYATYQFIQPGLGTWIARSRDNGLTWDFHAPIVEGPGVGTSGIPAHIVSDGSKTVAVAMNRSGTYVVAVSKDEGATWDINPVSSKADGDGSLVGFSMNPLNPSEMAIAYPIDGSNEDHLAGGKTVVRTSSDGGATWGPVVRMDQSVYADEFGGALGTMDSFPWIDYRGDKIAVAWYQSTQYITQRDPNNGATSNRWHVWYSESTNDGATFSTPEQVTTKSAKFGAICTNGLGCTADRDLGDFMQVAVDTHGKTYISMVHANEGPAGTGIYIYKQN